MRASDSIILLCYPLAVFCLVVITFVMHVYFKKKYHEGVIGFGLAIGMLLFVAYGFERAIALIIRLGKIYQWDTPTYHFIVEWGWTAGVIGTTATLCMLAMLVQSQDLSLFFERQRPKGKGKNENGV